MVTSAEVKKLRFVDDADQKLVDDIAREQAIIDGVIEEAVAQYQPREWDPELVRLMETMDWTFDYADRPNSAFYDAAPGDHPSPPRSAARGRDRVPPCRRPQLELTPITCSGTIRIR